MKKFLGALLLSAFLIVTTAQAANPVNHAKSTPHSPAKKRARQMKKNAKKRRIQARKARARAN